jgi:serine protease Do
MSDRKNDGVKDVKWQSVTNDKAKIKFINSRKKSNIRKMLRLCSFILIAMVSGGISGAYVASKREPDKVYAPSDPTLMQSKKSQVQVGSNIQNSYGDTTYNEDTSDESNSIVKVAETVGSTVVSIVNNSEGYVDDSNTNVGSGIIIDSKGYIVTNYDLIKNAPKITVKLSSGKMLNASIQGIDKKTNLAVIKVNANNLPQAKLGDSSKIKIGDTAIAIGSSMGENPEGSVTAGIISGINRKIEYSGVEYNKIIQTDAAINSGNNGGPLCNKDGEVIGINRFQASSVDGTKGLGFALSINEVKEIIERLIENGKVSTPYLGIYGNAVVLDNNKVKGVYIEGVEKGSSAFVAGIKPTDVLLAIDDQKVFEMDDVQYIINSHKVGDKIKCKILRNGNTINITVVLQKEIEN